MPEQVTVAGATVTLPLAPTRTYQCRELHWQRMPGEAFWGVLTTVESAKPRTKCYVNRYLVAEVLDATHAPGVRVFRLTKPGMGEFHYVELGGRYPACDCRGFEAGHECKHIACLRTLREAGYLEDRT